MPKTKTLKDRIAAGEHLAFFQRRARTTLIRWEASGLVSDSTARKMRKIVSDAHRYEWLHHFAAHIFIAALFHFGTGSIARFLWTLGWRFRAWRRRKSEPERYREAKRVHTLLVLCIAPIPSFGGASAYLWTRECWQSGLALLLVDTLCFGVPSRCACRILELKRKTWRKEGAP